MHPRWEFLLHERVGSGCGTAPCPRGRTKGREKDDVDRLCATLEVPSLRKTSEHQVPEAVDAACPRRHVPRSATATWMERRPTRVPPRKVRVAIETGVSRRRTTVRASFLARRAHLPIASTSRLHRIPSPNLSHPFDGEYSPQG
eukprot:scaffold541_cov335-Pavlova_lutheri.AAC.9